MHTLKVSIRLIYRLIIFVVYSSDYLLRAAWITWTEQDPYLRRKKYTLNAVRTNTIACKKFGIRIEVVNPLPASAHGLIVGNHMGFLDIMVMASVSPNLFVTSNEMKETPFLGLICEMGGCLFVERRSRGNIQNELKEMIDHLQKGFRVILYPEATSHNGEEILPFKRTLLTAAAHAGVPIYPYAFNFKSINNGPFTTKFRDSVCYYGGITFPVSMFRSLCLDEVTAEVTFLEPYYPKVDEDRGYVADTVRERIVKAFRPVQKFI